MLKGISYVYIFFRFIHIMANEIILEKVNFRDLCGLKNESSIWSFRSFVNLNGNPRGRSNITFVQRGDGVENLK